MPDLYDGEKVATIDIQRRDGNVYTLFVGVSDGSESKSAGFMMRASFEELNLFCSRLKQEMLNDDKQLVDYELPPQLQYRNFSVPPDDD